MLNDAQRDRYSRQVLFTPIGEQGQAALTQATVLVVGCGALGTVMVEALARAGVGTLRIADRDIVERSNLARQILFTEAHAAAAMPKALAATEAVASINSTVAVEPHVVDVTPETFNEGDTITLEGAFDDPGTLDSHMLVIDWGDGSSQTVELNVGDRTFEIQHTLLDDVPSLTASDVHQISVTLTDDDGGTTAAATNITVNNVAPEAAIEGPDAGVRGQPLNFMGNANDAGASDTHIFGWRVFNDDTGELVAIGRGPSYEFIPATSGSYTVELTITDDDLAMDVTTHDLEVTDFGVQIDPVTGETLLVMGGSVTADTVRVTVDGNGDIVVNLRNSEDGQIVETFDVGAIDRLVIYTQGGDDNINAVVTSIDLPVEIHAGDGNDVVTVDILNGGTVFGQLGDDTLTGRRGFNTLDGGPGNDRLNGGVDDDFLIGGLGDDRLVGNNGNDALRGDTGNDHLIGGAGNDFLNGGDGDDILEGNGGIDLLAGGLGQDILKGVRFEDEIEPGPDVDILQ